MAPVGIKPLTLAVLTGPPLPIRRLARRAPEHLGGPKAPAAGLSIKALLYQLRVTRPQGCDYPEHGQTAASLQRHHDPKLHMLCVHTQYVVYTYIKGILLTLLSQSNLQPFIHTKQRSQPRRATASSSETVRVRRFAQGHLDAQLGGAGDRTRNLLFTSRPALPPELLPTLTLCLSPVRCALPHLFDGGVVEEDPLGGLGVEGEGAVVTAGVADHGHQ